MLSFREPPELALDPNGEGGAGRPGSAGPRDVDGRFRAYRATQDPTLLSALVVDLMPLVPRVVSHYDRAGVPREDLQQLGYVGLMTAASLYDPDRGVPFEQFARHFIAGEIRHFLRDGGSPIRKPRWLYELDGRVRRAVAELAQRLHRPPTLEEIAREINVAEDGVLEVLRAREVVHVESLDALMEMPSGRPLRREKIVHRRYETFHLPVEDTILLADTIERLSELQRKVIYYLFYMDLTQTEVARRLRISQKHVSRTMHHALARLRHALGALRERPEV